MIAGILSNGFNVIVDETIVKTYMFSKIIGKACSKDANERLYANAIILEYLLGEDGETALLDYVRKDTGHEPTESEITALTLEIINLMKQEDEEIKKSVSSEES